MKNLVKNMGLIAFIFFLAFLACLSFAASSDSEGNVAIVCYLEGKAWLSEQSGKERSEIGLFDWIKISTVVETGQKTKMVLAFSTGERYELGEKTKAFVGQNGFTSYTGSVEKLTSVPVMPQIASISEESRPGGRLGGIRLRSWDRLFSGLYPNMGDTVLADELVITFDPIEGVEKYRIEIEDEGGDKIFSVETATHEVIISPGVLKPGANYYWQVRTLGKDKPFTISEAVFATLGEKDAHTRNAFKAQAYQSKDGVNLLLLAQMELSLGLRKEACGTLKDALSQFPDNAEIKNAISQAGCR